MRRFCYKILFFGLCSVLAMQHTLLLRGMAELAEGAETAVADGLRAGLGESLSTEIADVASSAVTDAFKEVPEVDIGNIDSEVSEAAFSKLTDELEKIVPVGETELVGVTAQQVEGIGNALTGAVKDLQKALPEGVRVSDAAIKESIDALKNEINSTADAFVEEATDLRVIAETGGAAEAGAVEGAAIDEQGNALLEGETGIQDSLNELNKNIENLGDRIEKMTPEAAKATWMSTIWDFVKQHILTALFGAFIFMAPNWIMGAIQAALTQKAELATIRAPQKVGGIWVQIPEPLIDTQNVSQTLPLYSRVIDKNVSKMFDTISKGIGEWAGSDAPRANIDNANFFVSSGNYDNCTENLSWGAATITSPNFAGQMIHLNSGLEFLGNGLPLNNTYPYRMLYPLSAKDVFHNCATNMLTYAGFLSGRLSIGRAFTETYDMYSGTGIFTTQGSIATAQGGGSARRDLNYTKGLAQIIYNPSDATKNIFTTPTASIGQQAGKLASSSAAALDYLKKILPSTSTFERISQPFNVGPVTVRVNNERVSGGFTLQAMQKPDMSVLRLLGVDPASLSIDASSKPSGLFDAPLPAQGYFVYQTADTPWAAQARRLLKGRSDDPSQYLYDYVVTFDENNTPIPALIPVIHQAQGNTVGDVIWSPNPSVRYLYSLVDATTYDVTTGKISVNPYVDLSKLAAGAVPPTFVTYFFSKFSTSEFATELKQGPFQYGNFTLTIPAILKQTGQDQKVFVYECAPQSNKNGTTLEGGFTDYLVPVDSFFIPVQLPSPKHAYFVSLVTSRIYSTDLTLVTKTVDFSILLDPSTQPEQVYIATSDVLTVFLSRGAQIACTQEVQKKYATKGCENLLAPLGTLYQEYDLNPYNQTALSVVPDMVYSIAQSIKSSTDPIYASVRNSNLFDLVATYSAARVVSSLQALGLTPAVIQELLAFWAGNKASALKSIGNVLAESITRALSQGISQNLITQGLGHASPNDLDKLLSAVSNKAGAAAFEHIGSNQLKAVLTPAAQMLFDGLATSLGIDPGQNYQVMLAQSGLIGVGPFYLYEKGMNLGPEIKIGDRKSKILYDYLTLTTKLVELHTSIVQMHTRWKLGLMGKQKQQWLLYEQFGPFAFTINQIPNVLIQAVSLEALQDGDFVYESSTYPGDYFIVASLIQPDNTVATIEPFNPIDPQRYLVSLVTGAVYERNAQGAVAAAVDKSGMPLQISNNSALRSGLKNAQLRKLLDVQASTQQPSAWKRYSFANFLLTIDPQDVTKGTYVYQDITSVATFPPQPSQITDYFVGVQVANGTIQTSTIGIPLEANPTHIVSVITGTFYDAQGPTNITLPFKATQLISMLQGKKTLRPALRKAIDMLIQQQQATLPPVTTPPVPKMSMDQATATALLGASVPYLSAPYEWLKFYNGKYYAVTGSRDTKGVPNDPKGSTLQSIFDYAGPTVKDAQGRSSVVGVLYNSQGYPTTFYEGVLLDVMRFKAGVVVNSDGTQVLSVPATIGLLDLGKNSALAAFTPSLAATTPQGTYTLKQYTTTLVPGMRLIADVKPTSGAPYYVDFYTGTQFTSSGKPRVAEYLVRTAKNGLIFARGLDAAGNPRFFAQGRNGNYFDYAFYKDFASTKNPQDIYRGFQAVGNSDIYLAIKPNSLAESAPWLVKAGKMGKLPSGGPVIAFDPTGVTFEPGQKTSARVYTYIGTGPSTVFEGPKVKWDANYANGLLVAVGVPQGEAFSTQSLFVSSLTKDERLASLPLASYIECKASGTQGTGKVYSGVLPGGEKTDFSVTFYDNLTDARTGAHYVCLVDANGIHFYVPEYQSTDAQILQSIQKQLNAYVSLTAYGDIALFKPLPNVVNLKAVAAVLNVPKNEAANVNASILQSNQFLFDATNQRYLYQFNAADQQTPYAPPAHASYVDLRSGVLYDATGTPLGSALTYPQLILLLTLKGVAVPVPNDNPKQRPAKENAVTVPASVTLTKDTPVLLYAPKPQA